MRGMVAIAVPPAQGGDPGPAPGWDVALDLDLTGLTVATLSAGPASQTLTRAVGGATVCSMWTHIITNSGSITTGATGVTVQGVGASGSASALVDVATEAGITLPDDGFAGMAVSVYCTGAVLGTTTNSLRAGTSGTQERFSQGTSNAVRLLATSSGVHTRQVSTGESHTSWATSQTNPVGAWVATVLVLGGEVCWVWYGATPPSDADLDDPRGSGAVRCSGTITADVSDAIDSVRYTAAHAGVMCSLAAGTTMTRILARTRRLA